MFAYSRGTKENFDRVLEFVANFPDQLVVDNPLLRPPAECLHLAWQGGEIVGCCGFDFYDSKTGEIRWLAVAPNCQGRFVGPKLMSFCLADALHLGVYQILAITNSRNRKFFERQGFTISYEGCEPLIRMRKSQIADPVSDSRITRAQEADRPAILELIRLYPWLVLDENFLPPVSQYRVVKERGELIGCCGIKIYGPKMAEIFSLAVRADNRERASVEEGLLVSCLQSADENGAYQTLNITHPGQKTLFGQYGFRAFNEEKVALIKALGNGK